MKHDNELSKLCKCSNVHGSKRRQKFDVLFHSATAKLLRATSMFTITVRIQEPIAMVQPSPNQTRDSLLASNNVFTWFRCFTSSPPQSCATMLTGPAVFSLNSTFFICLVFYLKFVSLNKINIRMIMHCNFVVCDSRQDILFHWFNTFH